MPTKRNKTRGLPKDYDDHGCKRQKTTMTAKAGTTLLPSSSPLDSADIASKIFPFLGAQDLLNFVSCRKDYSRNLTYNVVVRSILLTGGRTKVIFVAVPFHLSYLETSKCVAPDPIELLRYTCGKRSFGHTFQNKNPNGKVGGENSIKDYNSRVSKAIGDAIKNNTDESRERELWNHKKAEQFLQQLADLLGKHPCRKHLSGELWPYEFDNEFVDTTLKCVLDLKNNPGSVTNNLVVQASRELKKYYREYRRQSRILTCLDTLKARVGFRESWRTDHGSERIHLSLIGKWGHQEKRFVFYQEEADNVLKEFLVKNGDKPAIVAKQIFETIKKSSIYTLEPPSRQPS